MKQKGAIVSEEHKSPTCHTTTQMLLNDLNKVMCVKHCSNTLETHAGMSKQILLYSS